LDELGNYNEYNRGCAEVSGVSIGFDKGLDMNGAISYCSFVRGLVDENNIHGTYHSPCNVCGPLLEKIGIHVNQF